MPVVMIAHGFANGTHCPFVGQYLKSCDFEAFNGIGYVEYTADLDEAKKFPTILEAMMYWRRTSKNFPIREDGKPNRPLTSTHMEFVGVRDV